MSNLQQYISVIGGLQGGLLCVLLLTDKRVNQAGKILGTLCLLLAIAFSTPYLINEDGLTALSWLGGLVFFLPASYGALSYLYCRSSVSNKALSWSDSVHFIPLLACYLLSADKLFSGSSMLAFISTTSWKLSISEYIIFTQAIFYTVLTLFMIGRYRLQARETLANFNPAIFRWLWWLMGFNLAIWILKAIASFTNSNATFFVLSDLLIVLLIYLIAFAQWRNPTLFTVEQLPESSSPATNQSAPTASDNNGALDPATRATLFGSVKLQVEEKRLYRENNLTLPKLADATGLSVHHLSEVLNQHEGKSFYQFINSYRIAEVCERLKANDQQKILDIALQAGFASKGTFNPIFKQFIGSTPTQYRKNLALEQV
ncbi:helix-turn-helix domain-containing protein [Arenicella xantha]|uniref:AraC family transcriptional regulator n=1 Tax=Arenicella xantha TaxID=644221 RepID=A0A395JI58_9GAMM|nr:helix-turn-helix domain-containing protein [Arenicella xantha]RBP48584.1 AraC family transcriptional regulator [Arenicella xantha]